MKKDLIMRSLPVRDIQRCTGLTLSSHRVHFKKGVLKKIRQKHKGAYPLLIAHLELIICSPDFAGQGKQHHENFEIIKKSKTHTF